MSSPVRKNSVLRLCWRLSRAQLHLQNRLYRQRYDDAWCSRQDCSRACSGLFWQIVLPLFVLLILLAVLGTLPKYHAIVTWIKVGFMVTMISIEVISDRRDCGWYLDYELVRWRSQLKLLLAQEIKRRKPTCCSAEVQVTRGLEDNPFSLTFSLKCTAKSFLLQRPHYQLRGF